MDKESERFIRRNLEYLGRKLRNLVVRGIVDLVNDASLMQAHQIHLLDGEQFDNAERVQHYGFSAHPHPGAECFVVFCGAASDHPVILAVDDRRWRITGLKPGEVVIYTDEGDTITLKRGNIIEIASLGDVFVKAARSIDATAGTTISAKAGVSAAVTAPDIFLNGKIHGTSGDGVSFEAGGGVFSVTAKKFNVNADDVSINEGCE